MTQETVEIVVHIGLTTWIVIGTALVAKTLVGILIDWMKG